MSSDFDGIDRELADIDDEEGKRVPTTAARLLPMMVAAVALLSFGAIIYYAYNRGLTTGSEVAAPLITPDGPAKVKPDDPGGLEVPHQDKLVYGALDKTADDSRVEQLLPPPEDPMRPPAGTAARDPGSALLPKRDVPIPSLTGEGADTPALPAPELAAPTSPPPQAGRDDEAAPAEPATTRVSSAVGPLGSTGGGTAMAGTSGQSQPAASSASKTETAGSDLKPANGKAAEAPRVLKQPAAPSQPAQQVARATPAPEPAKTAAAPAKAAPAKAAPAGEGWRVQIASVRSADAARAEWQRQRRAHPDLLGPLDLTVKRVTLAEKGTFFRVQGGPLKDKAAAQKLCNDLKGKKVGCLIVRP